jgi:RHS repeat-associated protein
MSGARYRKIGLHGRPLPDEKPQHTEESDLSKEESYIDAMNLYLQHSTTDIHIPIVGDQLCLSVRRDLREEILNNKSGIPVLLRPDMPFGACWSTDIMPYAELVEQRPVSTEPTCLHLEPDYLTINDDNGSPFRFVRLFLPQDITARYLPVPTNRLNADAYQATLVESGGTLAFTKKFGTTIVYGGLPVVRTIPADTDDPLFAYTEKHSYYRAISATDRFGNRLTYEYGSGDSLIPSRIVSTTGQVIHIEASGNLVTRVVDPRGNATSYDYVGTVNGPLLQTVTGPPNNDGQSTVTEYFYGVAIENDSIPTPPGGTPTIFVHTNVTLISSHGAIYGFDYSFDASKEVYSSKDNRYFTKCGEPRWVNGVTLPGGDRTQFFNESKLRFLNGNLTLQGHRETRVIDAAGFVRHYSFTGATVFFLFGFDSNFSIDPRLFPIRTPKFVAFTICTVTHDGYGVETFRYQPSAGMALSSITDLSGNTTNFTYEDVLAHPDWAVNYPVVFQNDPTGTTVAVGTARQATKKFFYGPYRTMSGITDEEGRSVIYGADGYGRRTQETFYNGLSFFANLVQSTDYTHGGSFPEPGSKITPRLYLDTPPGAPPILRDGAPLDASPNIYVEYAYDTAGRRSKEIRAIDREFFEGHWFTNYETALITKYAYDANGNKVSVTDPRGFETKFVYDNCNRLIKVVYPEVTVNNDLPAVGTKELKYDLRGNKVAEKDENGHWTSFTYDLRNRLVQQRRLMSGPPGGGSGMPAWDDTVDLVTTYTYNNVNSRLSVTEPRNQAAGTAPAKSTFMDYDGLQRLIRVRHPAPGDITTFVYDPALNPGSSAFDTSAFKPTTTTDARGYRVQTAYDERYRMIQRRAEYEPGLFAYTDYVYDKVSNLTRERHYVAGVTLSGTPSGDAIYREARREYDALNRVTKTINVLLGAGSEREETRSMAYTSTGFKWRDIDELGRNTDSACDGAGRQIKSIAPMVDRGDGIQEHPVTQTVYDKSSNVVEIINPLGRHWTYGFDQRNRRSYETAPLLSDGGGQPAMWHGYDLVGNATVFQDANANQTNTYFDRANRAIRVVGPVVPAPAGAPTRPTSLTDYDKNGNVIHVTDPNGHETLNTYDALNRLVSTATPVALTVQSEDYDTLDATDATTLDAEITVQYEYDLVGNRITVRDGKNQRTSFAYDGHKRNTTVTDTAERVVTFGYNATEKVSRLDSLNHSTVYTYDVQFRVLTATCAARPQDNRIFEYDLGGKLLTVNEPEKAGAADVAYTYDDLNRIATETSGGLTHQYIYDLAGNRLRVVYGGTHRQLISRYDECNRLKTLTEGEKESRTTTFGYDLNGNMVTKQLPSGETVTVVYDGLNRRQTITEPAQIMAQVYDLAGNLVKITEEYPFNPTLNRIVSNRYDAVNRLVRETIGGLPAGSPATSDTHYAYDMAHNRVERKRDGVTTTYTYNNLNQLTSWTDGLQTAHYTYDFNGNRLTRTGSVPQTCTYDVENRLLTVTQSGLLSQYTYDCRTRRVRRQEGEVLTRIIFSGGVSVLECAIADDIPIVEYVRGSDWGGGVGGLLYSLRNGVASYNHYNSRGDVTTKTEVVDHTATVTWQAPYEAFGTRTAEVGATPDRQKANTKEEDPTGLLNEGFRYRDLETGVFITRDPLGFVDGPNLYTYVMQNPWTRFDPEGLKSINDYKKDIADYEKHIEMRRRQLFDEARYNSWSTDRLYKEIGKVQEVYGNYIHEAKDKIAAIQSTARKWNEAAGKDVMKELGKSWDSLDDTSYSYNVLSSEDPSTFLSSARTSAAHLRNSMKADPALAAALSAAAVANGISPQMILSIITMEQRGWVSTVGLGAKQELARIAKLGNMNDVSVGPAQLKGPVRTAAGLSVEQAETYSGAFKGAATWLTTKNPNIRSGFNEAQRARAYNGSDAYAVQYEAVRSQIWKDEK